MDTRKTQSRLIKRAGTDLEDERSRKRLSPFGQIEDESKVKVLEFRVLLPNGISVDMKIHEKHGEMPLEEFVNNVKHYYLSRISGPEKKSKTINWKSQNLYLVDAYENKITTRINLEDFKPNQCHMLRLNDGSDEVGTYENMWDLTPATDLLRELPEEYTFETALADLIDNSLQAVWSNKTNERKLISVKMTENRIEIFDTGPGMDGSHENSLVKWGKMGASSHRLAKGQAMGGNPPYLMPFFGMFGYGGFIASMHLGRRALVSSKTKQSKKVLTLQLNREVLLGSSSKQTWRTNGGFREPSKFEIKKASHGSFTKVEIFEPIHRLMDIRRLQFAIKDIYFPYIQSDEVLKTGRTVMPIEFQVNDTNLAEIGSGEVAVTNLLSCNGPEFTLQLHFAQHASSAVNPGHARLKCIYFPIIQGKESIDRILETLEDDGCGILEDYKSFSRVSIRRLGRLLPDARWAWLPFMEPKQRKGHRGQILNRCCFRVKCFIDTDAGFNPTPSKTDLAHHHPYTIALRSFGSKTLDKEKDVHISIIKDGKVLNLMQLEKQYLDWISQMHDDYDEEVDNGEDEPIFIVEPSNKKELGISSEVIRVHKLFQRKGNSWRSGQRVKILKGACAGHHKKNTYATLEYIILENLKGDAGGEARLICRPVGVPDDSGCTLVDGNTSIEIRRSISLPVSVIDSGKFVVVKDAEWECQVEKSRHKAASFIDILSSMDCQDLGIEGEFPGDVIDAGFVPPEEVVAVIRPASFNTAAASKHLDKKDIAEENLEMTVEITSTDENAKAKKFFSRQIIPSSRKGFHGLYILPLGRELPKLFQKAGLYTFLFALKKLGCRNFEKTIQVKALSEVGSWGLLSDEKTTKLRARLGLCFPPLSIACYDRYSNRIPFPCDTKAMIKISASKNFTAQLTNMKQSMSSDNFSVIIKDVQVQSCMLDKIRPSYEATFSIFSQDESFFIEIPCQVLPGVPQRASIQVPTFGKQLLPGQIITDLVLEIFDAYNNHVREHEPIILEGDGFCILKGDSVFEVDQSGCLYLSGFLKVEEGYDKSVSFSLLSNDRVIFKEVFQTERRELRAAFDLPIFCGAGTQLENLIFEVIDTEGDVDENIHNEDKTGQSHTLTLRSDSLQIDDSLRYSFSYGRCTVRTIPLPLTEGILYFEAAHSYHPELHLSIEVHVEQALNQEHKNLQTQSLERKVLSFQGSSAIELSKLEYVDMHNQTSDERLPLPDISEPSHLGNLVKSIIDDQKVLEEDLCQCGLYIKRLEDNMKLLNVQQSILEEEIRNLQAGLDIDYSHDRKCTSEKEQVMEQIAHKSGSAAAVICRIFQAIGNEHLEQGNDFADNILGAVAYIGIVKTNDLSRILAKYLGEDQILAIVCKSQAYVANLVKYEPSGQVNSAYGLHALAAELGLPISRQYLVICLDNIRAYAGEVCSDPQRKLALADPTLSNGGPPPGYLGYAVNMIDPDVGYWHWKTPAGHGLRETLFYHLFGELQVYESREDMNKASSCITEGAVSLDGGIIMRSGVFTIGHWEPDIQFPVICSQSLRHFSARNVEIMKQIEENKQKLQETTGWLKRERKTHTKSMKKFLKKRDKYKKFLNEKGPLLRHCYRHLGRTPESE